MISLVGGLTLGTGGVQAWLAVGLISGLLAGSLMGGGGYGIFGDVVLGLIGALAGGSLFAFLVSPTEGFWSSGVGAFLGAGVLIGFHRVLTRAGTRA